MALSLADLIIGYVQALNILDFYPAAQFSTQERKYFSNRGESGVHPSKLPELIRVQVKLARMSTDESYFEFHTSTKTYGGKRVSYRRKVEMFAVYCAETGKVYAVSVDQAPKMKMILRLSKVQVGVERKYIKWAKDYEI